jgi:ketosteroid isomerase-like protein
MLPPTRSLVTRGSRAARFAGAALLATCLAGPAAQGRAAVAAAHVSTRSHAAATNASTSDSLAVANALNEFLTAFQNLDWDRFRAFFSDDACVFFPSAVTPDEFCGREAVEKRFQQEFESIRKDAPGGPPFMHLTPDSLRIEVLGPNAALVMFGLHNAERTGRRTFVFRKEHGAWRIVHLHASNVPWPDAPK